MFVHDISDIWLEVKVNHLNDNECGVLVSSKRSQRELSVSDLAGPSALKTPNI